MSVEEAIEILEIMMMDLTDKNRRVALQVALMELYQDVEKKLNEEKISLIDGEVITSADEEDEEIAIRTRYSCPECRFNFGYVDKNGGDIYDYRKLKWNYCPSCGQAIIFPKLDVGED